MYSHLPAVSFNVQHTFFFNFCDAITAGKNTPFFIITRTLSRLHILSFEFYYFVFYLRVTLDLQFFVVFFYPFYLAKILSRVKKRTKISNWFVTIYSNNFEFYFKIWRGGMQLWLTASQLQPVRWEKQSRSFRNFDDNFILFFSFNS